VAKYRPTRGDLYGFKADMDISDKIKVYTYIHLGIQLFTTMDNVSLIRR